MGDVFGRAGALEAGVDRECFIAAAGAEGVARVPVEEVARFGVDGSWRVLLVSQFLFWMERSEE